MEYHQDKKLLPINKKVWSSWNVISNNQKAEKKKILQSKLEGFNHLKHSQTTEYDKMMRNQEIFCYMPSIHHIYEFFKK